ncbi:MAG: transglutaminaseTgpA domain-containing protein, partial [Microcystaceae cyanobacterium]
MTKTAPLSYWLEQYKNLSLSPPKTEESILFRILVQTMVIVGIGATDVAAQTDWSLWAIPLSVLGSVWSWHRRHERNIALKFLLAIGMLLVLFVFLSNLLVNLNDSRIALASLLVQLQVLHSFDQPRRKDLGYSMVIGLILLGVAGTVSQTMIFAPWLLLFLMVSLPTLILDYRSRLGLVPWGVDWQWFKGKKQVKDSSQNSSQQNLRHSPLSFRNLAAILGITLALGLTIFALMPRLPSYQLQSFPVSGAGDSENKQFEENNRDVINPGYVTPGKGGTGETGRSPRDGAGEMDDTFYYGFSSRMNQNLRGQMKKKLVLRVRSQSAGFWQALSFDHYTGQGWEISDNDKLETVRRSPWSYRFNLDYPVGLLRTRPIIQSYTAVTDLPNVIPNLLHPRALYFPTREIGVDRNGSLRSPVGLQEGMTYTVISEVPYRDRTALRQAPNLYNPSIRERFLNIPPKIEDKVRQLAISLLKKSPKPINSPYEAALFLTQTIKQNYTIQTDIPFLGKDEDLVESFLFKQKGGYPDHFSTVLTVMLRSIGIPARLAVGFAPGEFNPFTGYYL